MNLKKAVACTAVALAFAGAGAGSAQAADDDTSKFENNSQILSCDVVEVIDIPILSSANNNLDCSDNVEEEESETTLLINEEHAQAAALIAPRGH
ncbi:MAG TPA: hypothetical protein VN520_09510 [Streptomyces sp.]|uniref:hypothetical protein n=1 Tax=Streptomyces sp. TaxID=1931 RepID=UPI002C84D00F|nr:hypothetical protein [Streptomyces sp.]HWU06603.1 hypothetical protein [Streptomyces sp.]